VRGEQKIPVNGGPDVLRAIYGRGLEDDGYLTAMGGDGLYIFVSWDESGQQSVETVHQFGSATIDESSKHYDDQMAVFVAEELKPTFFNTSELEGNIEREYEP